MSMFGGTRYSGLEKNMKQTDYNKTMMANDDEHFGGGDDGGDTSVVLQTKPKLKKPSLYRVLLLNDDFTPMEFVVEVLAQFFQMDLEAATKVMLHVHEKGKGQCGVYTYEVAETKVTQVMGLRQKKTSTLYNA